MELTSFNALQQLDQGNDQRIQQVELQALDSDQNGELSSQELNQAGIDSTRDQQRIQQAYQSHNNDPNAVLFELESIKRESTQELIRNKFQQLDSDGDGYISEDNLRGALQSDNYSPAEKAVLQELLTNIETIEEYSNDEWGDENDGITMADIEAYVSANGDEPDYYGMGDLVSTLREVVSLPGQGIEKLGEGLGYAARGLEYIPIVGETLGSAMGVASNTLRGTGSLLQFDLEDAGHHYLNAGKDVLGTAAGIWEIPTTTIGLMGITPYTALTNGISGISYRSMDAGIFGRKRLMIVETNKSINNAAGISTGTVIHLNKNYSRVLEHEGGHSVHSSMVGPFYLPWVLTSYAIEGHRHSHAEDIADCLGDTMEDNGICE